MQQLDELGFLQHVSAISSTSGGGLAGAYYAIKGPQIDWQEGKKTMATNFLGRWIAKSLSPINLISTTFTHEDRSDLMAAVLDEAALGGATYGSLGQRGPRRPIFLANATDVNTGNRFTFDDVNFQDLASRLDTFPISQAVVASAAFPGAFNSVTLKNFPYRQPVEKGVSGEITTYKHLIDGGPSDNLGVEALIRLAAFHQLDRARNYATAEEANQTPSCFIAVVDAQPGGIEGKNARDPDPRSALDHIVDTNIFGAFDALLKHRRANLLSYVGLGYQASPIINSIKIDGLAEGHFRDGVQFTKIDVPYAAAWLDSPWSQVKANIDPTTGYARPLYTRNSDHSRVVQPPPPKGHFSCYVWHIGMSSIMSITHVDQPIGGLPRELSAAEIEKTNPAFVQHRAKLAILTGQIETSWKLTGPKGCSADFLQEAIYAAATVAVREDNSSRSKMCDLLDEAGLKVADGCKRYDGHPSTALKLPIKFLSPGLKGDGYMASSALKCESEGERDGFGTTSSLSK